MGVKKKEKKKKRKKKEKEKKGKKEKKKGPVSQLVGKAITEWASIDDLLGVNPRNRIPHQVAHVVHTWLGFRV